MTAAGEEIKRTHKLVKTRPGRPAHLAPVPSDEVAAGGAVLAGVGRALVQLLLAVAPRVAQGALAVVGAAGVDADARVLAQAVGGQAWGRRRGDRRHGGARGAAGPERPASQPHSCPVHGPRGTGYVSTTHGPQERNGLRFV